MDVQRFRLSLKILLGAGAIGFFFIGTASAAVVSIEIFAMCEKYIADEAQGPYECGTLTGTLTYNAAPQANTTETVSLQGASGGAGRCASSTRNCAIGDLNISGGVVNGGSYVSGPSTITSGSSNGSIALTMPGVGS